MNAISRALAGKEAGKEEERGAGGGSEEDMDDMGMGMRSDMTQAELEAEMETLRQQVPILKVYLRSSHLT